MPGPFEYFLNIPNAPNNPSNDQPKMQTNTNSIDSLVSVDHYTFQTQGNLDGWHVQSTYPQLSVDPSTNTTQGAVYTKNVSGSGEEVELFYRREANGSVIQITTLDKVTNTPYILTGTFAPAILPSTIVTLPANIYGYIQFGGVQLGNFETGASSVVAASVPIVNGVLSTNTSIITQSPIILLVNNLSLDLEAKQGTGIIVDQTWRIHYWLK